ncbi:zinc finger protein [Amniculicola lignicola CBS 123094]|uniref:Zinc finger protein n=1 Tax=Amniculicola lignicola CBS 123094 TaxID=1392246 RepID=A0A6A5W6G2_9PLEO|nr:zinc finger protein [Amniculicola lignicola CBS 123094]
MASQTPTQANVPSTHPYTCNTCQVAFRSSDLQRAHMQTDWHRYNLKRRVASLPPLSSDIFTEKVLANRASAAATAAKASFEKACQTCQKTYYSDNAYSNHLNSQKHKTNVAKAGRSGDDSASVTGSVMSSTFSLGEPMADSEVDPAAEKEFSDVVGGINSTTLEHGDENDPVSRRPTRPHHSSTEDKPAHPLSRASTTAPPGEEDDKASEASSNKVKTDPLTDCLFCNYRSPNFSLSINHMGRFHGMFIPEKDYLVDLEGLVQYLHAKIQDRHACLKCGKVTHTAEGIQTHMRDRGHCMIGFESDQELVEVGEFYDFSSTYSDAEDFDDFERKANDSDGSISTADGGIKLGAKLGAKRKNTRKAHDTAMSGDEEEDQGWETDSTVSSVPTDEITSVPIDDRSHMYKKLPLSRHHSHNDPRPHRSADGFHSHAHATPVAVYHDEYELHLPTGRTAGHRSLNKYYRQNLRNYPGVAERMEAQQRKLTQGEDDSDADEDMEGESGRGRRQLITRANGGTGMIGVNDFKKAEIRAIEKKDLKREQKHRNKVLARVEKQNNSQKHFRDPLLQ